MIKKIILPLFCVLLMFTQNKVAFAEVNSIAATATVVDWNGLFDDPEVYKGVVDQTINNKKNDYLEVSGTKTYTLEVPVIVNSVGYSASCDRTISFQPGTCGFSISFYDKEGKHLLNIGEYLASTSSSPYPTVFALKNVNKPNVKSVKVTVSTDRARFKLDEIELFGKYIKYESVSNVKVSNITSSTADLSYINPVINELVSNEIMLNGRVVHKDSKIEKISLKDLQPLTEYKLKISAIYSDGAKETVETNFTTPEKEPEKPKDVTAIKWTIEGDALKLSYVKDSNADYVNIYKDGKLVSEKNASNEFIDKDIKSDSKYVYMIVSYNVVGSSPGVSVEAKTPSKEVSDLSATSSEKDVSLTWRMPDYKNLDFARVYRKKVEKGMFARMFKPADTYEALFETNGNTFKDLTVKADTQYEYKVTTVDTKGNETNGKIISIKTKQITVSGGGTEKDENGDYVITWTTPTTGKIKVLVGGKEYAIVPAEDKKIVIPKDKMKFDLIGLPDVKLIPIDEDGNEGVPSKPGGSGGMGDVVGGGSVGEIINTANLLDVVMKLLFLISGFVLLALAFEVVPAFVKMIRAAFLNRNKKEVYTKRRIQE